MDNPHYVEYVSLLKRLHRLIAEGQGDTDAADDLRDAMDGPWHSMSAEEIARVRALAADLYTLEDEVGEPQPNGQEAEHLRAGLKRAWQERDWQTALELLRSHPCSLPPGETAFLRGLCWDELGDPDTAALFFERAARLDPRAAVYPVAVMEARVRAGDTEGALRYARAIMDRAAQNVA
jgi:hypothetical protein